VSGNVSKEWVMKKDIGIGDWVLGVLLWLPVLSWVIIAVGFIGIMLGLL
jgi:hypothetical protein